jgi:eukaryotic-like serine/threonine-protein kinase
MTGPLQPGTVLQGKYRVEHLLGEGGMGIVVAAIHLGLDQRVALKILRPELRRMPEVVERFQREARAASKIEGAHVAKVLDVGALDDGTPFMVMEHLEGSDLSSVRRNGRPLPPALAAGYLIEACQAIAEAHGLGIIHRDIKPANLFLAKKRSGKTEIKVLDFGISKLGGPGEPDSGLTGTAVAMGSAEYMSPEQMLSARDVDLRADIWSLGACLYELCTARGPFHGASLGDTCAKVIHGAPAPPRSLAPQIPPALEAIILRCLEKDRTKRFAGAAELAAALLPLANRPVEEAAAPRFSQPSLPNAPPAPRFAQPSTPMHAPAAPTPSAERTLPRLPLAARAPVITTPVLAGMMIIALMIIGIAFALGRSHEAPAPASASAAPSAPSARPSAAASASNRPRNPLYPPSPGR